MAEYEIKSVEDLKRANAAAQASGGQITNYADWYEVMQNLDRKSVV